MHAFWFSVHVWEGEAVGIKLVKEHFRVMMTVALAEDLVGKDSYIS